MTPSIEQKTSIWRDERFWKIAFQVITLIAVLIIFSVLLTNLSRNLEQLGIRFGFTFLTNEAGFSIGEDLVNYQPQDTYVKVLQAGLINSLRVIAVGIVMATVVGILAGVASFSDNWLVHKISRVYVGLVRNVPLLLQLFFWYFAVYFQLPGPQDQINVAGWVVMSNRGVYVPGPSFSDQNWLGVVTLIGAVLIGGLLWKLVKDVIQPQGFTIGRAVSGVFALVILAAEAVLIFQGLKSLITPEAIEGETASLPISPATWVLVLVALAIAVFVLFQQRTRVMVEQGASGQPQLIAIAAIVAVAVLIILFGFGWQTPEVLDDGGAIGGLRMSLEYAAAVTGLTFYTGAFIAEIVRAGIQSVSKGQWEAARSLGLASSLAMRLVVFPQALRVIIPPLNSEYMNLAKNTTLAFAIGYPELFSVSFTALNQTGRAVEMILLIMITYLVLNLLISVGMNQMNSLVQFKER
jgi:general L-amino acid transport system permease protein